MMWRLINWKRQDKPLSVHLLTTGIYTFGVATLYVMAAYWSTH